MQQARRQMNQVNFIRLQSQPSGMAQYSSAWYNPEPRNTAVTTNGVLIAHPEEPVDLEQTIVKCPVEPSHFRPESRNSHPDGQRGTESLERDTGKDTDYMQLPLPIQATPSTENLAKNQFPEEDDTS